MQLWCIPPGRSLASRLMTGCRTILFLALLIAVWLTPASRAAAQSAAAPLPLSPVIWSENPDVVQRFAVNGAAVRGMFDRSLLKLTSADDLGTAWTRLGITPQDVVGIKITTTGGQLGSTHRALIQAICEGLRAAGVPYAHIIIWDKDGDTMRAAGYAPIDGTDSHVGIASVYPGTGYDPAVVYKNEILGTLIWGDSEFVRNDDIASMARDAVHQHSLDGAPDSTGTDPLLGDSMKQTSNDSHYARLLTTYCTKIINVPVLTDNPYIGIQGCLGSLALGSVDNSRRFQGDPTYGDPAICEILDKDFIRHKVVLHVLDALVAQYAGGPDFNPQFTRSIGALYISRDPVAIDSIVRKRMEEWRSEDRNGRLDPIGRTASHIHSAASYNLGTDDPQRIQLIHAP